MKKLLLLLNFLLLSLTLTSCLGCDHPATNVQVVESTCTRQGYTNTTCKSCKAYLGHNTLELAPHEGSEWQTVCEPTCVTEGKEELHCDICNKVISERALPTGGHTAKDAWNAIKPVTCNDDGILGLKCKYCDEILEVKDVEAHHNLITVYGKNATCTSTGLTNGEKCSSCSLVTINQTVIPKKSHNYVLAFSAQNVAICADCKYTDSGFAYFPTKDSYTKACAFGSQYSGSSQKIIIKLSKDYYDYSFEIGSNVTQVVFTGDSSAQYTNIEIKILNRSSELTVDFENVNIVSRNSVLTSNECSQKITVRTYGESNSFGTANAYSGASGYSYFDKSAQVATPGEDGQDGADVFSISGDITFVINAVTIIKAGDGGKGGNGGSLSWIIVNGGAGKGGNGGDGGDAVSAGGTITVTGKTNLANFQGGKGGAGGKGGYNDKYSSYAADGVSGNDGKSGR